MRKRRQTEKGPERAGKEGEERKLGLQWRKSEREKQ